MTRVLWIAIVGIALALVASSGGALARPAHHHRYARRHSRLDAGPMLATRHGRIAGNRRTHVYYRTASRLRAPRNRVYLWTIARPRAAGYRPAPRGAIPINPRLTWRAGRNLPSLGTRHVPRPPKEMLKPLAPPAEQQPLVTPTNPMPN